METHTQTFDEKHAELCKNVGEMLAQTLSSMEILINIASTDAILARSIRWRDSDNVPITVPMQLRVFRRDLEWLEIFYKRGGEK